MRKFFVVLSLAMALLSCNDKEALQNVEFATSVQSIEVGEWGGSLNFTYTLPKNNYGMNAVATTEADWITDIDNSVEHTISFRVLPNTLSKSREAYITLKHLSSSVQPKIKVTQAAHSGKTLNIEVLNVDYSEYEVRVTPPNDDMYYVLMMAEKSYLTELGIDSVEELSEVDLAYFYSYITPDATLEEFLKSSNLVLRSKQTKRWQDLSPAREYVVYAYGVYINGEQYDVVTDVEYVLVEKRLPERKDIEFDVTIEAEGPEVSFDISPKGWDGYYVVQFVEDSEAGYIEQGLEFTPEAEDAVAEAFFYIADHLYYFEEKSAEEIMQQLGYKGNMSFTKTLNAEHRYMALIYAIESIEGNVPMVVSNPIVEYFSTGAVQHSDMTFEVRFENIKPRSVDVTITPSTDETYTAVMMYAKNLPEGNKQEQLDYVMSKYAPIELSGVYEEHIDQLPPATEFVIAVCGYYAGAATTELFVYEFTTAEDGVGKNVVTKVQCSAYDLEEVAALEPYYKSFLGYADYFLSVEVTTAQPSSTLHFDVFPAYLVEEYGEEAIRESLLEYSYTTSPDWALCSYGNEYIVCGMAEDENGYVGEMYISEPITYSKAETSDAAVFVELYKEYVSPKALIFRK